MLWGAGCLKSSIDRLVMVLCWAMYGFLDMSDDSMECRVTFPNGTSMVVEMANGRIFECFETSGGKSSYMFVKYYLPSVLCHFWGLVSSQHILRLCVINMHEERLGSLCYFYLAPSATSSVYPISANCWISCRKWFEISLGSFQHLQISASRRKKVMYLRTLQIA